ncbi:MAG: ATP-binding protein [Pseudomonadota bacterium]|nr:ATP-binding protein [Pseudomonadota bacterium]
MDSDAASITLADIYGEPVRLARITVCNWGPFDGIHSAEISPAGTLITGETGAGKSSLIDALQVLLVKPTKAAFNTAAAKEARRDRSLVTYVRGKYKDDKGEHGKTTAIYTRHGSTASFVQAEFASGARAFSLGALFWINGVGTSLSDVDRVYVVADRATALDEMSQRFETREKRAFKAQYGAHDQSKPFDHFDDYWQSARERLGIDNDNAPALLVRALGLKEVRDLTSLIRDLVLDAGDAREQAQTVVDNFDALSKTYLELMDYQNQQKHLEPLPGLIDEITVLDAGHESLRGARVAVPVVLGRRLAAIWNKRVEARRIELETSGQKTRVADAAYGDARKATQQAHTAWINAGGGQIEALERELESALQDIQVAENKKADYARAAIQLGLPFESNTESFTSTRHELAGIVNNADGIEEELATRRAEAMAKQQRAVEELQGFEAELKSAKARGDSAVKDIYDRLRKEIEVALSLPPKSLPFIAELIDVKPEHEAWRGAIERAVGASRLALLVPQRHEAAATRWINERNLGVNFKVRTVTEGTSVARFSQDSYLYKLEWRVHPFRDWLRVHLAHDDLSCVDSAEACNATPRSLTIHGLIHHGKGSYRKDDAPAARDRRNWCIGFTNQRRIEMLSEQVEELKKQSAATVIVADAIKEEARQLRQKAQLAQRMLGVEWSEIDVAGAKAKATSIGERLEQARSAGGELLRLEEIHKQAEADERRARDVWSDADAEERKKKDALKSAEDTLAECESRGKADVAPELIALAVAELGEVGEEAADEPHMTILNADTAIAAKITKNRTERAEKVRTAEKIIATFATAYPLASDWGTSIEQAGVYLTYYRETVVDQLAEHAERFHSHLNKESSHGVAALFQKLSNEREQIKDRIDDINEVMRRTELRDKTYLKIDATVRRNEEWVRFEQAVRSVMNLYTSQNDLARYEALKHAVALLRTTIDPAKAGNLESLRLIDPRYQFDFIARECKIGTDEVWDNWGGSGGKSGGEKETFAGTIVAASLAYVLTPRGAHRPSYTTVFLDEAFSNTSLAYSRRVLKAFRELGLHLNLITPFKNIELARECADTIVLVKRPELEHNSSLSKITWEYIDQHLYGDAAAEASAMGIHTEVQ